MNLRILNLEVRELVKKKFALGKHVSNPSKIQKKKKKNIQRERGGRKKRDNIFFHLKTPSPTPTLTRIPPPPVLLLSLLLFVDLKIIKKLEIKKII